MGGSSALTSAELVLNRFPSFPTSSLSLPALTFRFELTTSFSLPLSFVVAFTTFGSGSIGSAGAGAKIGNGGRCFGRGGKGSVLGIG